MDLMQLVALAEQESEGNLASGSQPQRGSARRFLSQPSCSRRQRAFGRRSLSKGQARNVKNFSIQAEAANSLGRVRTLDHLIPTDACEDRPRPKGKGQWKVWTPETMLRAAFAKEGLANRAVADQVDGASSAYARVCRSFMAGCLDRVQKAGWERCLKQAHQEAQGTLAYAISNMVFDETELEVFVEGFGPALWSILASHSQLTLSATGQGFDYDILRPPRAIPTKQAVTMWPTLCEGLGGLWPSVSAIDANFKAILTTCDAGPANLKVLRHLMALAPDDVLFLPTLCAQHRNGNVIERVTKLLGILPGSFAVAKTMKAGAAIRQLSKALEKVIIETLVVRDEEPPGLQDEWAYGRRCASALLSMVATNSQHAGACGSPEEPNKRAQAVKDFLDFFSGPWRGPTVPVSGLAVLG